MDCPESGGLDIVQFHILEILVGHGAVEERLKHGRADGQQQLVSLKHRQK